MPATISVIKMLKSASTHNLPIEVEVGPEVLTGSTRLNQVQLKLVLNMCLRRNDWCRKCIKLNGLM